MFNIFLTRQASTTMFRFSLRTKETTAYEENVLVSKKTLRTLEQTPYEWEILDVSGVIGRCERV